MSSTLSTLEQLPNTYRTFFGRFAHLTHAQKALIQPILDKKDVILQAGTGLGKTEAILAPATEQLIIHPKHFTILYIVPTRALALDMHRRIQPLYKQLGLKSGIRTGDGKTLQDAKPHLLILTPESLDVLLGSQNSENNYFLKHLHILIIDEIHTFVRTERGTQLLHLKRRLEMRLKRDLQILTLSATIGDPDEITSFFHLKNVFYYQQSHNRILEPYWVHILDEKKELISFFDDLLSYWKCKKLLVFANSRKKCEQLFEILKSEGKFSNNILLHYSNLSTKERRFIESSFRTSHQSLCIATSTLEMGIDIGNIDGVVLMGPPPSTMAFLQRIGRGNRRQKKVKFWGVCYGAEAERQLLRFLAMFELAKKNKLEKRFLANHFSVLFQQILSRLYEKKAIFTNSSKTLFNTTELSSMIDEMVIKDWLRPKRESGLFYGGWRYKIALQRMQIWSNFPPAEEEYEVILEKETIATLPLSIVKQLEIGDTFQLSGKELKLLQIEEKKASKEILVEASDRPIDKELSWHGHGALISFEVAHTIKSILLSDLQIQGLLTRTRRLLENARHPCVQGENGLHVHRLNCGAYRFETFLGTVGNFILHTQIKHQLSNKIKGLFIRFDEIGIESNEWIPFEILELPLTTPLFEQWVKTHLPLLRQAFPWNSWLSSLPKDLQKTEICTSLLDPRVLEHFEKYRTKPMPSPPTSFTNSPPKEKRIPLKGKPWSFNDERQAWKKLSFQKIPHNEECELTANQIQVYVAKKNCARLAHFQRVGFSIKPHPRFQKTWKKSDFKKQVFKTLPNLRFETDNFTLKQAIDHCLASQTSLFLARVKLSIDHPFPMKGSPDLIYLKYKDFCVHLEVWDIKDQEGFSYAQKWQLAFYVYLLERLLKGNKVIISSCAGIVHRNGTSLKRTPFKLLYFTSWMPHLIDQWKNDSMQVPEQYSLNTNCTSCRYFSYCYQETLLKNPTNDAHESEIICVNPESIDFPPNTDNWQSIRPFLQQHFTWPIDGLLTATQVARCLGLVIDPPPPISLYHDDVFASPDLYKEIWNWCASHVKCIHPLTSPPTHLIDSYLFIQRREWEARSFAILAFQKNPLPVRVEQFRAIGPLTFLGVVSEKHEIRYLFSIDPKAPISKFRVGDFLKLSLVNCDQIQKGFSVILTTYSPEDETLSVKSLSIKMPLSKNQLYALDECATDWNAPKIETVLHRLKNPKFRPELIHILHGHGKTFAPTAAKWVEKWYSHHAEKAGLNAMQKQALLLPFLKNIGLIEGPPGTGKTHLLIWTLIALVAHAKSTQRPIKILVTALTHQAIDQILLKLFQTFEEKEKIPIWKYGRLSKEKTGQKSLKDVKQLVQNTSFILGATGFGVYQLLEDKQFPKIFDWVIIDEASQILPSYAILSLIFGKGNALLYGDTQQLPPIMTSNIPARSILEEFISRFDPQYRLRLNKTYRMNGPICQFISRNWYNRELQSAVADKRLKLPNYPLFSDSIDTYLNPLRPLTVVPVEHEGNLHSSKEEALWIAQAVKRLTLNYNFSIDEIGIISPHRLQNNIIYKALKETLPYSIRYPKIDTVERMQGQEFDLVLFSATVSDEKSLHNAFLKDTRRFNVSISRARKKFLFIASPLFFKSFPKNETELIAHFPFEDLFTHQTPNLKMKK